MFKYTKKQQHYYDDQEFVVDGQFYLSEKDRKALQKKAKKEFKRGSKKYNRNESQW